MEKYRINICSNGNKDGQIFCAISFAGGNAIRDCNLSDGKMFRGNYAFFNVFMNCLRQMSEFRDVLMDCQRTSSSIVFTTSDSGFIGELNTILKLVLQHSFSEEQFNRAKEITVKSFEKNYADEFFRARLKAYEFSELNKAFLLKALIDDIRNINYEIFCKCADVYLTPGNACIYVFGDCQKIDVSDLEKQLYFKSDCIGIDSFDVNKYDPYMKEDAHIFEIARNDCFLSIESLSFVNEETTLYSKKLVLDIMSELIESPMVEVYVDEADASLMFENKELIAYKEKLLSTSIEDFTDAKKKLQSRYFSLMNKQPEVYCVEASQLMVLGIDIDQYIDALFKVSYEDFSEIMRMADVIITEAQIVLKKGA